MTKEKILETMQLILDRMGLDVYDDTDSYRMGYATAVKDLATLMGEDKDLYGVK